MTVLPYKIKQTLFFFFFFFPYIWNSIYGFLINLLIHINIDSIYGFLTN
jgi:hypothetical protein